MKKDESLIKENFLAWEHGPVIRKIYDKLSNVRLVDFQNKPKSVGYEMLPL